MRTNRRPSSIIPRPSSFPKAFTLVELLVVVAIIAVLVGILIPVVGKIRISAQETSTRSLITQIESACQAYYGDYTAYPGPFSPGFMVQEVQTDLTSSEPIYDQQFQNPITDGNAQDGWNGLSGNDIKRLTGTENLVLGLTGGLEFKTQNGRYGFNKDSLGLGAMRFSTRRPGRSNAYMQNANLSEGKFTDEVGALNPARDTIIPEFVDGFNNPIPILYLRARKSSGATGNTLNADNNNVVVNRTNQQGLLGQYNLLEIAAYTQSSIGVGRKLKPADYRAHEGSPVLNYPHGLISVDPTKTMQKSDTANYRYPYDAYAYLTEPSSNDTTLAAGNARMLRHQARKKDSFILISAGKDRVYGTEDDLTNFGSVLP